VTRTLLKTEFTKLASRGFFIFLLWFFIIKCIEYFDISININIIKIIVDACIAHISNA
jgi:hypothetical protein